MEKRTIQIDINTARSWYKKGDELKKIALVVFNEDELTKFELPKTWEEYCDNYPKQSGEYYINSDSNIFTTTQAGNRCIGVDRNLLPSRKAAEAHLALMQLHQLRDIYRQGWVPDWKDKKQDKWVIKHVYKHYDIIHTTTTIMEFLSFQTEEIAREFLNNFKDLIEKAGDLI